MSNILEFLKRWLEQLVLLRSFETVGVQLDLELTNEKLFWWNLQREVRFFWHSLFKQKDHFHFRKAHACTFYIPTFLTIL